MGTPSIKKFLKNVLGTSYEEAAITDTAGAADADKIPATNEDGVLDPSLLNATATSAGAADANRIPQLGASGRLDPTMMPEGLGADTASITTSEALSAGNLVNVHNVAGAFRVRKADATVAGKEANGFVLAAYGSGVAATVYFEGPNTSLADLVPGAQFLSTTAGGVTAVAPSGSGNVVQRVGTSTSATSLNFEGSPPIVLA
jgi:hypothetical protein